MTTKLQSKESPFQKLARKAWRRFRRLVREIGIILVAHLIHSLLLSVVYPPPA